MKATEEGDDMTSNIKDWRKEKYIPAMKAAGLKEGDTIIDYGCSVGNYTIPLAQLAGENGRVYAVDTNSAVFSDVRKRVRKAGLDNVITMIPERGYRLDIEDGTVEGFIIYDLIHFLKSDGILVSVLSECRRLLREGGILSILPFHLSPQEKEEIWRIVEKEGFAPEGVAERVGLHFEMQRFYGYESEDISRYERGDIKFFKRKR